LAEEFELTWAWTPFKAFMAKLFGSVNTIFEKEYAKSNHPLQNQWVTNTNSGLLFSVPPAEGGKIK
jgi:hypothetical protein